MMYGYGGGMGWAWVFGLLALVGIALLVVLMVRLFSGGVDRNTPDPRNAPDPRTLPAGSPGRSRARQILDERFAQGDLTAEQYREQVQVLGEGA
ncbi:SHOCT domain-containing protein [Cryobacterium algoritolerans]|uniref:SHOCT domain-containing protein n=1 Tax=Cryobacterium algoritolerans TaxID=1259184 RepID=A0A4R8WW18_9MICO|nr:SHOCT domain-containing protein [Cryobacterium algoritolerans]TFC17644.1 SHOCT domain-containing protein [Cryobacterium algoritolerans]